MTDEGRKEAWLRRCSQLEALGVDAYSPQVPPGDSRHPQVQAILTEYQIAIGEVVPVPPGWEGHPPLRAIKTLADLAAWLNDQWTSTRATEMGGEKYQADALTQAARAVRNGFRVLAWLGVDERPERPLPAEALAVTKRQLDDLERWVRQKVKDGWTPRQTGRPPGDAVSPANRGKRRKRAETLNEYETNHLVIRYLRQHPGAPIRDIAEGFDLSVGTVQQTEAWRREMARRKAAKPLPKIKERQLTKEMLATLGQKNDPAAMKLMKEEAIWRWLLENAQPHERAGLHMKTPEEKADLIELSRELYDEAHAEPGD